MCGGDIDRSTGQAYGTCLYCGTQQTLPVATDEQKANLYNRANHYRRQNEFDKAMSAYDSILNLDATDAEAHWGFVLSKYGIEYVEDPVSHEQVPTCHRVQVESILTDADYIAALENAGDGRAIALYEAEARRIADIQRSILAVSSREEPCDVFICYKETTEAGSRTRDSALAQDIYYGLVQEGYRVFFSRITLEDKLGEEYEPYIFAALHSARVMVVIGTKPEYINAVWVRNEWSRFLVLMKRDRSKLLIPCYRDMDPYDMPEALSMLQSQDMSKIGFLQDLLRGIRKVLGAGQPVQAAHPAPAAVNAPGPESFEYDRARLEGYQQAVMDRLEAERKQSVYDRSAAYERQTAVPRADSTDEFNRRPNGNPTPDKRITTGGGFALAFWLILLTGAAYVAVALSTPGGLQFQQWTNFWRGVENVVIVGALLALSVFINAISSGKRIAVAALRALLIGAAYGCVHLVFPRKDSPFWTVFGALLLVSALLHSGGRGFLTSAVLALLVGVAFEATSSASVFQMSSPGLLNWAVELVRLPYAMAAEGFLALHLVSRVIKRIRLMGA